MFNVILALFVHFYHVICILAGIALVIWLRVDWVTDCRIQRQIEFLWKSLSYTHILVSYTLEQRPKRLPCLGPIFVRNQFAHDGVDMCELCTCTREWVSVIVIAHMEWVCMCVGHYTTRADSHVWSCVRCNMHSQVWETRVEVFVIAVARVGVFVIAVIYTCVCRRC